MSESGSESRSSDEDSSGVEHGDARPSIAVALPSTTLPVRSGEISHLLSTCGAPVLGKDLWRAIAWSLDSAALRNLGATCWAFWALLLEGEQDLWEERFAREKRAGAYHVQAGVTRWKLRFHLAKASVPFLSLVNTVRPDELIILAPGAYEVSRPWFGMAIMVPVHIIGCGYARKRGASLQWHQEADVPKYTDGAVTIFSSTNNVIEWRAHGGSITNCDIRFTSDSRDQYYYSLWVREDAFLTVTNCAISSAQHTGVCLVTGSQLTITDSRVHHCQQAGMTLLTGSRAVATRCLFDSNLASGVECVDGNISMEGCVVLGNLAGVGINGEHAQYALKRCNVFSNRLNGIEVMDTEAPVAVTECVVRNNLHGVIVWRTRGTDAAALERQLVADNALQGNRVAEARVKVRDPDQTLVQAAEADGVCTFTYTGPHFFPHVQTGCRTCGLDGVRGCCSVCARVCHAGHDLGPPTAVEGFFCDCGSELENSKCAFNSAIREHVEEKRRPGQ